VGWQPSRFLTDRAEAERAFRLAEQLGSVNAAGGRLSSRPGSRKPPNAPAHAPSRQAGGLPPVASLTVIAIESPTLMESTRSRDARPSPGWVDDGPGSTIMTDIAKKAGSAVQRPASTELQQQGNRRI
jgi:hypothetical protein